MSDGGGDGGDKGGGDSGYDSGAGTTGGGFDNGGAYEPAGGWTAANSGSPAGPSPTDPLGGILGGSGGSDVLGGGTGGGTSGADVLGTGSDSGFFSGPSAGDIMGNSGYNLAGSGPVGGVSQPMAASGVTTSGAGGDVSLGGTSDILGTTSPSSTGGTGASAFAAPSGVSGTSDLTSWVSNPAGDPTATSPYAYDNSSVLASIDPAMLSGAAAPAGVGETLGEGAASLGGAAPSTTLPATTPAAGGAAASPLSSGGGGGSSTSGPLGDLSGTKGLGVAAAAAGLLNNLINSPKSTPAVAALNSNAADMTAASKDLLAKGNAQGDEFGRPALQSGQQQVATGTPLQQYVATGQLPQGYEDQIQQQVQSAKAALISSYANRGMVADPARNSSLAQELSQIDQRIPAMREQMAAQLAQTGNSIVASGNQTSETGNQLTGNQLLTNGLSAAGISNGTYTTLANLENDQNKQRAAAIANFAAALNGGTKSGVNINLGGAKAA